MSAKKSFETKVYEDEELDSGAVFEDNFSEDQMSEGIDFKEDTKENKIDRDEKSEPKDTLNFMSSCSLAPDSGVIVEEFTSGSIVDDFAKELGQVQIDDGPLVVIEPPKTLDIPPPYLLYFPDEDGDSQIHIAAVHGCEKSVSTLIKVCPDKRLLDLPNNYGHTALHLAVMSGHAIVARMLVLAGASIHSRDFDGNTPLHKAVAGKRLDCLQALLGPSSDQDHKRLAPVLNQKNYKGEMCVHLAAATGHIEALQMLQYYDADLNTREGLAGWTPHHIAAQRRDERTVKWLLDHGVQRTVRDYAGRLPRKILSNDSSGEESETDDDEYDSDSDGESFFQKLRMQINPINVA